MCVIECVLDQSISVCYNAIESVLMYISVNEHHSVSFPEYVSDNQCAKSVPLYITVLLSITVL